MINARAPTQDGTSPLDRPETPLGVAITPQLQEWVDRSKAARTFAGLNEEEVAAILAPGVLRHYQPGDVIIEFGDTSDSLFVLLKDGKVRIIKPITLPPPVSDWFTGEKSLVELPAPIAVGDVNFLASTTRSATVEALTEIDAVEVQKSHLEELGHAHLHIGYALMRNIALSLQFQLRQTNEDVTNLTVAVALAARALKR
jgi:CRP-like cAMP-binding protein